MTKRGRAKHAPQPRLVVVPAQARCSVCGRYRVASEACWFCHPPASTHCHCDDSLIEHRRAAYVDLASDLAPGAHDETCGGHVHLRHAWLERQWQLDLEAIDESILLPTEMWEDDEGQRSRQAWRDDPDYKAWLRRHPQLRERARRGAKALLAFFDLSDLEGEILDKAAIGYTPEGIAQELGLKPDWVELLLAGARSKYSAKMARLSRELATVS